jgi:hypothetical protein
MSETQKEPTQLSPSPLESIKTKIGTILSNWKVRLGLVGAIIAAFGLMIFFWPHLVAVQGMKTWAARAGYRPIECMLKDTNDDHYISCSAMSDNQIVPLECSSSVFNLGCRVRYGSSVPPIRPATPTL